MRGSRCLFNSRHALYRVFISPVERHEAASLSRQLLPLLHRPAALPLATTTGTSNLVSIRTFATRRKKQDPVDESVLDEKTPQQLRWTTAESIKKSGRDRMPQDHEITDPRIMVMEHGTTEGPLSTNYVLSRLEIGESLRMIHPYVFATEGRPQQYAVCKIVNKRDEYQRQREVKERKRAASAAKPKLKEVTFTWSISEHDLGIKMRQIAGFLEKGFRVELTIGRKKGGRAASTEEIKDLLQKVKNEIEAMKASEPKPVEGNPGRSMKFYLESTKQ